MGYVGWALLGMVGYSLTTFFVKLATRGGLPPYIVLLVAVPVVGGLTLAIALANGDLARLSLKSLLSRSGFYALVAGMALAVAVTSLFRALSMGPASVVVPIYGMFIVGGAVLGMTFLGETVTARKVFGIVLAVIGVVLIAR